MPVPIHTTEHSHTRQRQQGHTFFLGLLILIALWLSAFGYTLWHSYGNTLANGQNSATMQARSIEENLTQSLRLLDLVAGQADPEHALDSYEHELAERMLSAIHTAPFLRSVSLVDQEGRLLLSTSATNQGVQIDLQQFYPASRPDADVLRIGLPWQGRDLADGRPITALHPLEPEQSHFVPVLHKLPNPGKPLWLVATLNPDYFIHHAEQLVSPDQGSTQWLRYDGVLLFSTHPQDRPGAVGAAGPLIEALEQHSHGSLQQQLPNGGQVITAYRTSADFPVLAAVHLQRNALLADWWSSVKRQALIVFPVLLACAAALTLAWKRRQALLLRQAAQEEQQRLAASVFQISRDATLIADASGRILAANAAFERLTGYNSLTVQGQPIDLLLDASIRTETARQIRQSLQHSDHWQGEQPCRTRQGHAFTARININTIRDTQGLLRQATCTVVDVTQERAAERSLRLAASVFSHAREGILITDTGGHLVEVNDAFTHITGYSREEVIGRHTRLLSSGRQSKEFYQQMWKELLDKGHWSGEMWNRRKSGEVYAQVSTISAVRDAQGEVMHYVALVSDISQQKENERRLQHIAHFDALTGLPNRVLLADRLRQAMAQSLRRPGMLALVFLDLDGFKAINDTHGHNVGDKLLIGLASRMKLALREGDTLARLGGDEFVALLMDLPDHEACLPVLDRLRLAAAQPIISEGVTLQVSASLGVAFYPQNEPVDADQLLRQADQAMYQAKLAGKNRFHVFDAAQDRDIRGRNESLESIRLGLQRQEFRLHYQPKVNMRTGQVLGAEALVRWQHPKLGLLPPARFLPSLEDHPLALELGYWVIETALRQIETWYSLGMRLPVSVNVDAQLLQQNDFVDTLRALLSRHPGVHHGDLELEVLETSALDDMDRVAEVIDACRALGVHFALDDFGTGYSSLTYLRHLPTRQLKIDQSFVRDMLDDPDDLAILDGVIGLAIAFRRDVIAEGVETVEHGQMLLRLGCDWAQGYVIAKPMPPEEFPNWARTWRPPECWMSTPRTKREDLPLLFAAVEHRAWIAAVVQFLMNQRDCPPALNPRECRLGHWIEHEGGRARHGVKLQFSQLETQHLDIHRMAEEMISAANQQSGDTDWLEQNVQRLHAARDELLGQLLALE